MIRCGARTRIYPVSRTCYPREISTSLHQANRFSRARNHAERPRTCQHQREPLERHPPAPVVRAIPLPTNLHRIISRCHTAPRAHLPHLGLKCPWHFDHMRPRCPSTAPLLQHHPVRQKHFQLLCIHGFVSMVLILQYAHFSSPSRSPESVHHSSHCSLLAASHVGMAAGASGGVSEAGSHLSRLLG